MYLSKSLLILIKPLESEKDILISYLNLCYTAKYRGSMNNNVEF